MRIYTHFGQNDGCRLHRVVYPLRYCANYDFPDHDWQLSLTDPSGKFDCYHLYGLLTPQTVECIGTWKRGGGKFVLNVDDLMDQVLESNPCRLTKGELAWWELSKDIADLIITSTPELAAGMGRPSKTVVARNLLEVSQYRTAAPNPVVDKFRILWAGSRTHADDLAILDPVIDHILTKFGADKLEFVFVGAGPGQALVKHLNRGLHLEPGVTPSLYPELLSVIRPQIVLAPLVDCPFNRAKSCIRTMEAGCLAAPVVASPVAEYERWTTPDVGFLASTTDEWVSAIETLIENDTLRTRMGTTARKKVGEEGDWANADCRHEWRGAFQRVLDLCS